MHVLVTGASSGIGEACARAFGARGDTLTLVARRGERLEALKAELKGKATVHVVPRDLSDPSSTEGLVALAEERGGPLDVVMNNAGVQLVEHFRHSDRRALRAMVDLNLTSAMLLAHEAIESMLPRRHGTIVNVCSVASFVSPPGMAAYGASKAGLSMLSEVMAAELQGSGVHVVTVYPGPVRTPMGDAGDQAYEQSWATRGQQWGEAPVLAKLVVEAVDRERPRVVYPRAYAPVRFIRPIAQAFTQRFTPPMKPRT